MKNSKHIELNDDSTNSYNLQKEKYKLGNYDDSISALGYSTFFYLHQNNIVVLKQINAHIRHQLLLIVAIVFTMVIGPIFFSIEDYRLNNSLVVGLFVFLMGFSCAIVLLKKHTLKLINLFLVRKQFKYQTYTLMHGVYQSLDAQLKGEDKYQRNDKLDIVYYNSDWEHVISLSNINKITELLKLYLVNNQFFQTQNIAHRLGKALMETDYTIRYLHSDEELSHKAAMVQLLQGNYKNMIKPFK